ncbi:MAG TPA: Rieske (2Fe-2S) protein [Myxococcales bacterium]|nr:Rieske (2Fe-2S) protein [Myxococcales bacterium]
MPDVQQLPNTIDGGNASGVQQGSLRAVSGFPVAIGRDQNGVYALSLICTHEGCDMSRDGSVSASLIDCACHGSLFDGQGNVLRGPASSPLDHFVVTADVSGELTIHTDQTTPSSTRLPA